MILRGLLAAFCLVLSISMSMAQTILWQEDFSTETDGDVTGSASGTIGGTWNVIQGAGAACSKQTHVTSWEGLQFNQNGATEGVWSSGIIDISALGDVAISANMATAGASSSDYIRMYYIVNNNGVEIQFAELLGSFLNLTSPASAVISGTSLEIIVRGMENTAGNFLFSGEPNAMGVDDITVTDITSLYSIADGDWDDSNTWSDGGYGGTTCSPCLPTTDTKVFIGNGHTVNFNVAGDAVDVNVESTGILQWTANNIDLNIQRGGSVNISNGGTLTLNGNAGAQIDFDDAFSNSINVATGGVLSIGDIDDNGSTSLAITGGGTFTVNDDFLLGATDGAVTNTMTGTFTITDQLNFEVDGADFLNNSALAVQGATGIVFTGDDNTLINSGTLDATGATQAISVLASGTGNQVSNSGTLNAPVFRFNGTGSSLTSSGTLTLTTLYFDAGLNTVTNSGTFTVPNIQCGANSDDDNIVTNSVGGVMNIGTVNPVNADFDLFNSGTINQTGNFTNINSADTNFDNLATGTWNWSLTPNTTYDTDMNTVLNCSAAGNTFNYSGAGAQRIITSTYYHLLLNNSGTKTPIAALNVDGNLTLQNSVTLSTAALAVDVDGNIDIQNTAVFGDGTSTGTINIGGNWTAVDAASYVQGTRTVNFDGAGAQVINNASGTETFGSLTLSQSGAKSSSNLIDVDVNLTIANTAQFNVANDINLGGNWSVTSTNANPFVEGTNTVVLDGTGAQAISTVLAGGETFHNLNITGTGTKSNSSIINVSNDLSIGSGGSSQLSSGANITIGGAWTVNSSNADPFVQSTNTVTFNGGGAQSVTTNLAAGETFYNLVIAKSVATSSITLNDIIAVSNALTMTSGILQTTSTNLLVLANAATSTIGSASSYVDGPTQFNMAVSGVTRTLNFPIGKNGVYGGAALTVRHSAATSYSYTAEVIASSAAALGFTLAGTTDKVSALRYWDIKRGLTTSPLTTDNNNITTSGGNGPRLQLYYSAEDAVNQASTLTIVKSSGNAGTPQSPWLDIGGTATGTPAGNIAMGSASANFTYFSYFTLANETGGTNPLPIELLHFNARLNGDIVDLDWATASELNNDFFTIERTSNIEQFEDVGEPIEGAGTTKERKDYSMVDASPLYGRSYYRLKQTDFDGKFTYSDVQVVDYDGPTFASLRAYPNPSDGTRLTVLVTGLKEQSAVPIQIYNVQGQMVYESILDVNRPGTLDHEIEFGTPLNAGVYFIKAGPTLQLTQKIFIR